LQVVTCLRARANEETRKRGNDLRPIPREILGNSRKRVSHIYRLQIRMVAGSREVIETERNRSFVYDSLSRLTSAQNPESGTAPIGYTYDADGNLATKTASSPNQSSSGTKQVVTTYTYDALNRLTGKSYTDGYSGNNNNPTPSATYGYDGVAPTGCTPPTVTSPTNSYIPITPTNTIGRRSSMCDGSGTTAWIYDSMGRPAIEERTLNGVTKNLGYVYYLGGQVQQIWYASGDRVFIDVSAAGRLLGVAGTTYYVADNATYAPNGAVASLNQYTQSGSYSVGLGSNFVYNKRLQLAVAWADYGTNGSNMLYERCYDFHVGGGFSFVDNPVSCSFSGTSPADNGNAYQIQNKLDDTRTQNFTYDSLNRVWQAYTNGASRWGQTYATAPYAPGAAPVPSTFGIDPWGNLTTVSGVTGIPPVGAFAATATTANQLICASGCSLTSASYDAAGNVLSSGNGAVTYDDENRISVASGVTYTYDGDGKRVEKSTGTLYWTGVGSDTLSESDLSGNINEEYAYFNGMLASRADRPSNTVHAILLDHLGSARMMVTPSGTNTLTTEEDLDYSPYGIVTYGTAADHYKFTGKERDSESTLDNFDARYYTSNLGRFMTPDWAARPTAVPYAVFGDPQSLNLYGYVRNDPVTSADADGHGLDCGGNNAAEIACVGNAAFNAEHGIGQQGAQRNYTIQVVGADGKRHSVALKVGSQVLMMKPSPGTIDPKTGAAEATTTYKVNDVKANELSEETKPTEVRMKESITRGSNCSAGCSNKSDADDYNAAMFPDTISAGRDSRPIDFTQQFFIGDSKAPATLLRPIDSTGYYDMGTRTHVTESQAEVTIQLEQ
jgi:RHS repeat-associated protein